MTYQCDVCRRPLPAGYVPQVDMRGRPCLAVCKGCDEQLLIERAQRLGISVKPVVVH